MYVKISDYLKKEIYKNIVIVMICRVYDFIYYDLFWLVNVLKKVVLMFRFYVMINEKIDLKYNIIGIGLFIINVF